MDNPQSAPIMAGVICAAGTDLFFVTRIVACSCGWKNIWFANWQGCHKPSTEASFDRTFSSCYHPKRLHVGSLRESLLCSSSFVDTPNFWYSAALLQSMETSDETQAQESWLCPSDDSMSVYERPLSADVPSMNSIKPVELHGSLVAVSQRNDSGYLAMHESNALSACGQPLPSRKEASILGLGWLFCWRLM